MIEGNGMAPTLTGALDRRVREVVSGLDVTFAHDATIVHRKPEEDGREAELPLLSLAEDLPGASPSVAGASSAQGADLRVVSHLASGGMGAVFIAHQRALDREVVVKRLLAADQSPDARLTLVHEARTLGALEHPNIVPVHALGREQSGAPVIVMKRVEGISWRTLIRTPEQASAPVFARALARGLEFHIEVLMSLCNALHFAHSRGVVHRDLKPENVMIGAFGEVYLLDWGIALRTDRPRSSQVAGTPCYMAPEMLLTPEQVDARTDVYLLGATLHEVLVGHPPHRGATIEEVLRSVLRTTPFDFPASAPADLVQLCRSALATDPAQRPPSCEAFRDALGAHNAHRASREFARSALEKLTGAEARLEADRQALASVEVGMLLAEARFGLEQSLQQWPENDLAALDLGRCLAWSIERELLDRNATSARALLVKLPHPRPDLETRVADIERAAEAARAREAEEARLRKEMDASVSARPRVRLFGVILVTGLALALATYLEEQRTGLISPMRDQVAFDAALATVMVLGVLVGRRRLLSNAFNRRLWALWGITVGGISCIDVFLLTIHGNSHHGTVVGFTLMTAVFAAGAALLDRSLALVALTSALAALTSALFPSLSTPAATFGLVVSLIINLEQSRRAALRARTPAPALLAPR